MCVSFFVTVSERLTAWRVGFCGKYQSVAELSSEPYFKMKSGGYEELFRMHDKRIILRSSKFFVSSECCI